MQSMRLFGDNAWSTEEYEWDVCFVMSHTIVATELCATKDLFSNVSYIAMSVKPVSVTDFALPR